MNKKVELAQILKKQGLTIKAIADQLKISLPYAHSLVSYNTYRRARLERGERKRRSAGKRSYECSVCGATGHNAGRHRSEE